MGVLEPPGGVSKATKCDRNQGAVGDWFLLRGWQMLMLTDRESDYSELWRWTSACVSWLPWQRNQSQSHLHKSRTHIPGTVWKQHHWAKVVMLMKEWLSGWSAISDHRSTQLLTVDTGALYKLSCELPRISYFCGGFFMSILGSNPYKIIYFGLVGIDWIENMSSSTFTEWECWCWGCDYTFFFFLFVCFFKLNSTDVLHLIFGVDERRCYHSREWSCVAFSLLWQTENNASLLFKVLSSVFQVGSLHLVEPEFKLLIHSVAKPCWFGLTQCAAA